MKIHPIPTHATLPDMPSATNSDHDGRYFTETEIVAGYVPYTGANTAVDLGSQTITTTGLGTFGSLTVDNTGGTDAVFTMDGTSNTPGTIRYESDNTLFIFDKDVQITSAFTVDSDVQIGGDLLIDNTVDDDAVLVMDGTSNDPGTFTYESDDTLLTWDKALTVTGAIIGGSLSDGTATLSSGNLTSMGNITGTDVDISAGTGDFTTTGTGKFATLGVGGDEPIANTLINMALQTYAPASGNWFGIDLQPFINNSGSMTNVGGLNLAAFATTSVEDIADMFGVSAGAGTFPTYSGDITNLMGIRSQVPHFGGGTVTDAYLFRGGDPLGAGTITTLYGLHLPTLTRGGTNWQIFSAGGASNFNAGTLENNKFKLTAIGGFAIKLTNTTGANTVQGQTVKADPTTNDAVILTAAADDECFGVFLDSGVADDAEAWVVVSGIADVAMEDDTAATAGNWVETSDGEAGYANAESGTPNAAPAHFEEIGHCIETVAAGGEGTHILARCVLHFN